MPGGRKPRLDPMVCPNPLHTGSKAKGNGTRRTVSGLRRNYRCTPNGGKPHDFAVVIEVEDEPIPVYVPPPACPVHGKQARRVRNGSYRRTGKPVRRQRYRCWPNTPDPAFPKGFHNFTPPLAREHVHTGDSHCRACEERRNVHHGDQVVARRQSWNLRVVAEGLEKLASGAETYSSVGRWAWQANGRSRTRPSRHIAAGRNVDANTTLGALAVIAARHLRAADAAAFHDKWSAVLGGTARCGGEMTPFDACHECRADRACPADTWPHAIAVALTGVHRNLNPRTAGVWLGPTGRLVKHATVRPAVAAHAA